METADVAAVHAPLPPGDDPVWAATLEHLPAADRASIAARPAGRGREQHQAGRLLLRTLLAETTGIDDWQLVAAGGAKPRLLSHSDRRTPSVSISHCADRVLCAVSSDGEVGADVERRCVPGLDALSLARQYLAAEEAEELRAIGAATRDIAFLRLWTRKEAIVKAAGVGLAADLGAFAVDPVRERVSGIVAGRTAATIAVRGYEIGAHLLALALATPHAASTVRWRIEPRVLG